MGDAVCAVRGGPGSYRTRLAALEHAAATGDTIHFLSVVDPAAYDPLHEGEQHAIRTELAWRELVMAKAIAARSGIEDPPFTVEVRVGEVIPTIAGYSVEVGAGRVIVGTPRAAPDALLAAGEVESFAAELGAAAGVPVILVPPEAGGP